jgi:hypothetical protein
MRRSYFSDKCKIFNSSDATPVTLLNLKCKRINSRIHQSLKIVQGPNLNRNISFKIATLLPWVGNLKPFKLFQKEMYFIYYTTKIHKTSVWGGGIFLLREQSFRWYNSLNSESIFFYFTKNFFVAKSHPLHVCVGWVDVCERERKCGRIKKKGNSIILRHKQNGNTHARFKETQNGRGLYSLKNLNLKKKAGDRLLCVWKNKRRIKLAVEPKTQNLNVAIFLHAHTDDELSR